MSWYTAIGLISTLFQGTLLFSLTGMGMSVPQATPIAVLLSGLVNFTLNYQITWQDRFAHLSTSQRWRWYLPLFLVFVATTPTLWLKIAGITAAQSLFGGPLIVSWVASEALGAIVNYIGADRIAFGAMARVTRSLHGDVDTGASPESRIHAAWRAMRPEQWVKNVFVLAAAPFAVATGESLMLIPLVIATLAFCAASSSVYLVNDFMDRERDRAHPIKRHRPIATGALGGGTAIALSIALAAGALSTGFLTHRSVGALIAVYLVCSHAYSLRAKHVPLLDLILVGSLYGIRVAAGFAAGSLPANDAWPWALLATLLGIVIVIGKRRGEWRMLRGRPSVTRPVLTAYAGNTLPRLYTVTSLITVLVAALAMWQITPLATFATVLIAIGFARFWAAVESDDHDRNPQDLLLADRTLCALIAGFSGLLAVLLIAIP